MRILVFPHSMEIGGSQLNAIELAEVAHKQGHDVVVVSQRGPLVDKVRDVGLEYVEVPAGYGQLSVSMLRFLTRLVDRRSIDVVHGYEWPPAMASYFGPSAFRRVPVVGTIMSMAVAPFLPRHMPLVVGTENIRQCAIDAGHRDVTLIEPPVDIDSNSPAVPRSGFRSAYGLDTDGLLISLVGRLAGSLKREGVLAACECIGRLAGQGVPVQLAVVGDGSVYDEVAEKARLANKEAGRRAVVLTGSMSDPRPAYAEADIILGMGGSALRGMAFGKPLVVQGELGFWRRCTPETADAFLHAGWYGLGDLAQPVGKEGISVGASRLQRELEPLLTSASTRRDLGAFGRDLVTRRFSLARAAMLQEKIYMKVISQRCTPVSPETARSAIGMVRHTLHRKAQRLVGNALSEDFNAVRVQKRIPRSVET